MINGMFKGMGPFGRVGFGIGVVLEKVDSGVKNKFLNEVLSWGIFFGVIALGIWAVVAVESLWIAIPLALWLTYEAAVLCFCLAILGLRKRSSQRSANRYG